MKKHSICLLAAVCFLSGGLAALVEAQGQMSQVDQPLVEIDLLDPEHAPIRRYALTARHVPGREIPIPDSQNLFCTLDLDHNVILHYYRDIDTWVFQVAATDSAERAAGGIATCLDLTQRPIPSP